MDVKYKIWIDNDGNAFGFGTYYLLEAIDKCGSLSQAAKMLEMSYSRAHSLLKQAGLRVGFPLIESQAGGAGGGITAVTPKGKALMKAYKHFIKESDTFLKESFIEHFTPFMQKVALPPALGPLNLHAKEVITFVGGGGKTSLMYLIANALAGAGKRVVITTTTKIGIPGDERKIRRLLIGDESQLRFKLDSYPILKGEIVVLARGVVNEKLDSLSADFINDLIEDDVTDYILVEADGSSRKPFKAPAEHEPPIPPCSTLVLYVIGVDCLGNTIDSLHMHRPELISELCGLNEGEVLTAGAAAEVAMSHLGGKKNVPPKARWLPVINKVDNESVLEPAINLAKALIRRGTSELMLSSTAGDKLMLRHWGRDKTALDNINK